MLGKQIVGADMGDDVSWYDPEQPERETLQSGWFVGRNPTAQVVGLTTEVPVTEEMIAAVDSEFMSGCCIVDTKTCVEIYRAMAALAPVPLVSAAEDRITALEAENAALKESNKDQTWIIGEQAATLAVMEVNSRHWAKVNRDLEAENAILKQALDLVRTSAAAKAAAFGPATDTPDPPRRPDGTLAPAARPLPMLKTAEPQRRVGG